MNSSSQFSHNVNNPVWKGLQGRYTNKYRSCSCSKFRKSPYIYILAAMFAHHPISLYNIIQNSPTSLAHNSLLVSLNNFEFGTRHVVWSYRPCQNLGQIDRNLHIMFLMTSYANHQYPVLLCPTPDFLRIHIE